LENSEKGRRGSSRDQTVRKKKSGGFKKPDFVKLGPIIDKGSRIKNNANVPNHDYEKVPEGKRCL